MSYKELKELLIRANNAYYIDNNPIMSDFEFDQKLKELKKLEDEQGFADPDSPTQKVGSDLSTKKSYEHLRPMLSLENTYNTEDVEKWYIDMCEACHSESVVVSCEPKWDGCSCAIRFLENGEILALTRGNGLVGEDITQNVKYLINNIWPKFEAKGANGEMIPFRGEVRGELIMTRDGFEKLNKDGKYQNPRNLLSGTMKLLDIHEFAVRAPYIKFKAYWLEDNSIINDICPDGQRCYSDDLDYLHKFGFDTWYLLPESIEAIINNINFIEESNFDVDIDGAVLKLNDKTKWDEIGSTAKAPRWARAYKYKQESVETKIVDIEFWVGRTGKITPVAWFEPRFIDGSTVQKATLNNKEFFDAMDVAIGDTVEVQKAAAIIPQIINVTDRPDNRKPVYFPTHCPVCGEELTKHNDEHNDWYCDNDLCPARIVDRIVNYTHNLEIDGFAEIVVERMYENGILKEIKDLYSLDTKIKEIASLDRMSENIAKKLVTNINNSKNVELWKLIAAFGIPGVGPKIAKDLAKHFKSIRKLQEAQYSSFVDIDGIGHITAWNIADWFETVESVELIATLELFGQSMELESEKKSNVDLSGKTFCITGALTRPRDYYVELIERCGGKFVNSVSKNLSYLVTNDKTTNTTKNTKARELGISIIDENELINMCNGGE